MLCPVHYSKKTVFQWTYEERLLKELKSIDSDEKNLETKIIKASPATQHVALETTFKKKLSVQIVKLKSLQKTTCPT